MQVTTPTTLLSAAGGTLLTIATLATEDLLNAVVLSMAGAATSFATAAFLSWLARRFRKDR